MRRALLMMIMVAFPGNVTAAEPTITSETAAQLIERFRPDLVTEWFVGDGRGDCLTSPAPVEQLQARALDGIGFSFRLGYWPLGFRDDPKTYVMLGWMHPAGGMAWALVRETGGSDWELVQDSQAILGGRLGIRTWVSEADLDLDGAPEVLVNRGFPDQIECLFVYRWTGERLESIVPLVHDNVGKLPLITSATCTSFNGVQIVDLDEDGTAEIVRYPALTQDVVGHFPDGSPEVGWIHSELAKIKVFHMVDGRYELQKELPPDQPVQDMPVTAVAAVHPGTIPTSALEHPGGGRLRVFVSRAAFPHLGPDWQPDAFSLPFADGGVSFKKEWTNQEHPNPVQGNGMVEGVPVWKEPRPGQGAWTVNPSRPAVPAPDRELQYRLLGDYVELRVKKKVVYPHLEAQADRFFEANPDADVAYLTFFIDGRLDTGKRVSISAYVCVQRTGEDKENIVQP